MKSALFSTGGRDRSVVLESIRANPRVTSAEWIETTYAITLVRGWRHWELNGHSIMANTAKAVREKLREVEPCGCEQCVATDRDRRLEANNAKAKDRT